MRRDPPLRPEEDFSSDLRSLPRPISVFFLGFGEDVPALSLLFEPSLSSAVVWAAEAGFSSDEDMR